MPPYMYTDTLPCGTYAAYRRHLYRGESPCLPCRKARAAYKPAGRRQPASPGPRDRDELAARIDAARGPGTASRYLLDICEAIEGPSWEWYSERRADGAA